MVRFEEEGRTQRVYEDAEARGISLRVRRRKVIPVGKQSQSQFE